MKIYETERSPYDIPDGYQHLRDLIMALEKRVSALERKDNMTSVKDLLNPVEQKQKELDELLHSLHVEDGVDINKIQQLATQLSTTPNLVDVQQRITQMVESKLKEKSEAMAS